MLSRQEKTFKNFAGKFVKIRYKDGDTISIARGILLEEKEKFLFLKGDYTEICILKDSILKITSQEQERRSQDESPK